MEDRSKIEADLESDSSERSRIRSLLLQQSTGGVQERSLAKTTKIVNRLKKFYTESSYQGVVEDFRKLDWSPYTVELLDALMEAFKTMKLRDSFAFVEICCHCRSVLPSFETHLVAGLRKQLDTCINDQLRLRVYVRCLSELTLLECIPRDDGVSELVSLFESVLLFDSETTAQGVALIRLQAIAFWVTRYGNFIGEKIPILIKSRISEFYATQCPKLLQSSLEGITAEEARRVQIRIDKGQQLDAETEAKYAALRGYYDKLNGFIMTIQSSLGFADLDLSVPVIEEEPIQRCDAIKLDKKSEEEDAAEMQFTDQTEKSFYVDLLDVAARVPSVLLDKENAPAGMAVSDFMNRFECACNSREAADALAMSWFEEGISCKGSKRLIYLRCCEKDTSAFQARFIANIFPFSTDLCSGLTTELKKRMTNPNQNQNQTRAIKTYSELCKFGVAPPGPLLDLLAACANDLNATNGEIASWILVACGRFLINKPETKAVTENLLVRIMKLKNASVSLPAKVEMALDDAYFQTKPKLVSDSAKIAPLTDMQKYILHLIHVEVYRMQEDALLYLVKRLPWSSDPLVAPTMKNAILELSLNVNFVKCDHLASLLAGLIKFKEEFVLDLIDSIFEQFQISLEKEDFRLAPSRVRLAKFIGELYVFKLIDSGAIFDVLFQLIGFRATSCFGAGEYTVLLALLSESEMKSSKSLLVESIPEDDDPVESNSEGYQVQIRDAGMVDEPVWSQVRIILISTIIFTVSEFFSLRARKNKGERMKRFLLLFRRYVILRGKQFLSNKLVNVINDMFDSLDMKKFDIRSDTIEKINDELAFVKQDLEKRTNSTNFAPNNIDPEETAEFASDDDQQELVEIPSVGESPDDYEPHVEGVDAETENFDREMQALMIESLSEARLKKFATPAVSLSVPLPPSRQSSSPSSENEEDSKFKVLSKSHTGKPISTGSISLPNDHKLFKGQEQHRIEQEAAAKEKEKLKRFIMAYERETNAPTHPAPQVGRTVTIATAVGITSEADFDNKMTSGSLQRRSKFKK